MLVVGPYIRFECSKCHRMIERKVGRDPFKEMNELRDDNALTCAECVYNDFKSSLARLDAAMASNK